MSTSHPLVVVTPPDSELDLSGLEPYVAEASELVHSGEKGAESTGRAYAGDWKRFTKWCKENRQRPLPASSATVAGFLVQLFREEKKPATIQRHKAAISRHHRAVNLEPPTDHPKLKALFKGILRKVGKRQKQAEAFTVAEFKRVIRSIDASRPGGLRARALLLLGFAGAFRRQELSALDIEQLNFRAGELIVTLLGSKTNQLGEHEEKAIFYSPDVDTCPLRTLQQWLAYLRAQGATQGPLFRSFHKGERLSARRLSADAINDIVQRHLGAKYSAHSLRASFVTVAKLNGADDAEVMNQTKHKSSEMIRRYTRVDSVAQYNAGKKLGL
ncbi:site-specific integrase [Hymenobacter sp. NST-14]|uniref:site-specific integrase n=1 Tax=Hymenobacter piscis TaxID=2839984 RepID=UPI001C029D59|nr:tyrosine-type recombinase/integrase [Hymenobacter piscis]MBT9394408.1 site-specific integrase [Hymenobacter piscis]